MGLFGLLFAKAKIPAAVADCRRAISPQLAAAGAKYSSPQAFEDHLGSSGVLLFVHGFINYFALKHGLSRPESMWAVNVHTFDEVFGEQLGTKLILGLQRALRDAATPRWPNWIEEGENAARYFDREGMELLAAFLEGGAR